MATSTAPLCSAVSEVATSPVAMNIKSLSGLRPWARAITRAAYVGVATKPVVATVFPPFSSSIDLIVGLASMYMITLSMLNMVAFIGTPVAAARIAEPMAVV